MMLIAGSKYVMWRFQAESSRTNSTIYIISHLIILNYQMGTIIYLVVVNIRDKRNIYIVVQLVIYWNNDQKPKK